MCVCVPVVLSYEESANSVLYCSALFVPIKLLMLYHTTRVSENLSTNISCAGF